MSALDLAERLIAAGIPVVVVKPTRIKGKVRDIPPPGWNKITAEECDLSGFRPGKDALAIVGGHGLDAVDVDTKANGSVDHLPPFKHYGVTRTPSGGEHYIVPSSGLGKITPLETPLGFVGDYVGGRPDGTGRLLLYLPGSVRGKYPDGGYVEEVPWRVEDCLSADPDPDLVEALENAGGAREDGPRYEYDGPQREAALGVHPLAAEAIAEQLARLDMCTALGWDGPHWDDTTFAVACELVEYANSGWTGYSQEDALGDFLEHAPTDEEFGPREHDQKWASAVKKVGSGGKRPQSTPAEDFAEPLDQEDDPLFDATPTLAHVRQAAHSRMVSAPALLCYVLGRVLAEVEPNVSLPPVIGSRAALNIGIAVVGESGAGKSALLNVSRDLMGLEGAWQEDVERAIGSGEGLVQSFLRWDPKTKSNVLIDEARRILTVDEVDSLGATQGRNGSTIAPTIRTAVTGGPLGQENATADRKRHVRAGSYRLILLLGVQPTRSGTLLNDADAGTPQRLVWVKATDPSIPANVPDWPGPLMWHMPALADEIDYPDHIKDEVRKARLRQARGGHGADSSEGHKLLTRLKVATALALLHGDASITNEWWCLAGLVVDASMSVQEECRRAVAEKTVQQRRSAGRLDAVRQEGAAEYRDEKEIQGAVAIWRTVNKHAHSDKNGNDQTHDADEGCTDRCVSRALRNFSARKEIREAAIDHAVDASWITDHRGRWLPGDSRPAETHPRKK